MAVFLDGEHDGRPTRIAPANGHHFTLDELHTLVGGYIEVVNGPTVNDVPLFLVLNEDGKRLPLPPNGYATSLFHDAGGPPWDYIVGNVVLCTLTELNEDDDEARIRAELDELPICSHCHRRGVHAPMCPHHSQQADDHDAVDPDDL